MSNLPPIDPPLRSHNFPQSRCRANITWIDVFNKNAIRRERRGEGSGGGGGGGRKDTLLMQEEPGGRCVRACLCVFVSYLAAVFTSFASTDVVGEKLFLKAHLKNLRCYKTQHPHVFGSMCVCVRACQRAERAQIDLTLSLLSSITSLWVCLWIL